MKPHGRSLDLIGPFSPMYKYKAPLALVLAPGPGPSLAPARRSFIKPLGTL